MGEYRVWCLSWEDDEKDGESYPDTPPMFSTGIVDETRWANDDRDAVRLYAEYCHSHRDGWESTWPLRFRVRLPTGETRDYDVEREAVPEFVVGRKPLT